MRRLDIVVLTIMLVSGALVKAQDAHLSPDGVLTLSVQLTSQQWTAVCASLTLDGLGDCDAFRIAKGDCPIEQNGLLFPKRTEQVCWEADILRGRCLKGISEPVRIDRDGDQQITIADAEECGTEHFVGTVLLVNDKPFECVSFEGSEQWLQVSALNPGTWLVELVNCSSGQIWLDDNASETPASCRGDWRFAPSSRDCQIVLERSFSLKSDLGAAYVSGIQLLKGQSQAATPSEEYLDW